MTFIFKFGDEVAPSLKEVLTSRGWIQWDSKKHNENEWNLLWSTKRYLPQELFSLHPIQRLNHFKNTSTITKKDHLLRNLRRMTVIYGKLYNFYPESWMIPLQYSEFLRVTKTDKNYKNNIKPIWIAKPSSGRRGENIIVFDDLSQFTYSQSMIVQRYIHNPLLIGGYKFDLRIYVLVTSFRPLEIWLYRDGLCRFSTKQYDLSDLSNCYSHLTNASINKTSNSYDDNKPIIGSGSKWTLIQLFEYFKNECKYSERHINKIRYRIRDIIILTLLSIVNDVQQSNNCFEMFGFDIMIDENLKCWLIEVNGSPAIAITCPIDEKVKRPMLNDLISCINVERPIQWNHKNNYQQTQKKKTYKNNKSMNKSKNKSKNKYMINEDKENSHPINNQINNVDDEHKSDELNVNEKSIPNVYGDLRAKNVGGYERIYPFTISVNKNNHNNNKHIRKSRRYSVPIKSKPLKSSRNLGKLAFNFAQSVIQDVRQRRNQEIRKWNQIVKELKSQSIENENKTDDMISDVTESMKSSSTNSLD